MTCSYCGGTRSDRKDRKRCYGCGAQMPEPPQLNPLDLLNSMRSQACADGAMNSGAYAQMQAAATAQMQFDADTNHLYDFYMGLLRR